MIYAFGDYTLNTDLYELRRAGEPVKLERQAFEVLTYLMQHREHVVSKHELFEQLWTDRFVSDKALERCVQMVRRALGDSHGTPRFIQTLRSRGYRFISTVQAASPSVPPVAQPPVDHPAPPPRPASWSDGTPSGPLSPRHVPPESERRQLTVMCCRLMGFPERSEPLDPEELLEVVRDYHAMCAEVVRRFEGHIAQYQGDGLVVHFGSPWAHEDDAHRAVHTGLGIVEGMERLNRSLERDRGMRLAVRVGIHTGIVVVTALGRGDQPEPLTLGDTPTIAAQLQDLAAPDTVVISPATLRLIEGYFAYQALGAHVLDDPAEPLAVYQVLQESAAQSRFEVTATQGLTPLVGREQEVGLLRERWEQVREGAGQVVLLSGEGGIGKSRLVQVFREHLAGEAHTRVECHGSPYYQNSALYPVVEHIQRLLQWRREDTPQEQVRKLEGALAPSGFSLEEMVPLLAALLSLPLPEHYVPPTLTPQQQKQKTLEALLAWLLKEAERQPVCLVMEDLHWVDPSTLEWLGLLIDQVPMARLFVLLLFRPDFHPPWTHRSYLTHITLGRLSRSQVETMVERVTGGKTLPAEVIQPLVAKTDGVPLFVEELTKMVLESGLVKEREGRYVLTGPLPPLAIPATLHDSLMARLDRLGPAKQVAQLGAVVGREFAYEVLWAVAPMEEAPLQQGLAQLVEAELLYQRGLPPQARYLFKHALIQEAAYQSLLRSTRRQYHQQIAQVLEDRFPEIRETQPELLAHHYTEAGLSAQAVPYWRRAGQRAVDRSANIEAISHLRKGLEVLKTLPDTAERTQQELTLQLALGVSLSMSKGYTASEVEHTYIQARDLCQQLGDSPQLFSALAGLKRFYTNQAEYKKAQELGEQLLRLAQSMQDPLFLSQAHGTHGVTLFHLGEFSSALEHLEQGIAYYDSPEHRSHTLFSWNEPVVLCLSYAARALWYLGYPDQALRRSHKALALAQQLSHAHTLSITLHLAAMLHKERREPQLVQELAEAAITLASKQGFTRWLGGGMIRRGWALAEQGSAEEGIVQLRQGLAIWRDMGIELALPQHLAMLAEAYAKAGRAEVGVRVLDEALAAIHKSVECQYEAELYRLKGELLLQQALGRSNERTACMEASMVAEVEPVGATRTFSLQAEGDTCFRQAIEVARYQRAKSLELRAVMSLSRLWQQQGKRAEARQMLEGIYGWFTEGFDTPDLQEAKALLEALQYPVMGDK